MSHEITQKDAYGYAVTPAWHGLGFDIGKGLTGTEGFQKIGALWRMKKEPVYRLKNGEFVEVDGWFSHVREDTDEDFTMVGKNYQTFQNSDLCELLDLTLQADPAAHLNSAGTLRGGRKVFGLIELGEFKANGGSDDTVKSYLCVVNAHDKSGCINAFYTTIRVVCANTLRMAMKDAATGFKTSHMGDLTAKMEECARVLGIATAAEKRTQEMVHHLRSVELTGDQITRYFSDVFARTYGAGPGRKAVVGEIEMQEIGAQILADAIDSVADPGSILEDAIAKWERKRTKVLDAWTENHEKDIARGNAWGALNAVTEYHDHHRKSKSMETHAHSVLFGQSDERKQIALDEILTVTNGQTFLN